MSQQRDIEQSASTSHSAAAEGDDVLDRADAGAKVIRGGAIRGVAFVATLLLTGSVVPIMTRHLGPADFGRFVTASSVVMIVAGITELGLTGIGTREYALASPQRRSDLLGELLGLRCALTVVGLAVATLLMVIAGYPHVVTAGMLISGGGLLLLNVEQTYVIALTAQLEWGAASVFELINAVVIAVATAALVLAGAQLLPFFLVSVISSLAALLAAAAYLHTRVPLLPKVNLSAWRKLVRDTLPYAAAATVGILYPRIGLIVVSLMSSSHQAGYYSTAYKIVEVLGGTCGLIASSAFPLFARAARDDRDRLRYATGKVSDTTLIAGVYITLSLVLAAPFVIAVVGGAKFAPAVSVLRLQAVAVLGGFVASTWSYTLLTLRMHRALLVGTTSALAVSILLSAALVPSLGANGASIASAICELVVAGAYIASLAKQHPDLRPSMRILPRVGIAALVASAAMLLPLPSVAIWAIASIVYLALIAVQRAIPAEIVAVLASWVRSRTSTRTAQAD